MLVAALPLSRCLQLRCCELPAWPSGLQRVCCSCSACRAVTVHALELLEADRFSAGSSARRLQGSFSSSKVDSAYFTSLRVSKDYLCCSCWRPTARWWQQCATLPRQRISSAVPGAAWRLRQPM